MKNSAIGIDLGGTNLKGIVMDREGRSRHLIRGATGAAKGGQHVLSNILDLIAGLIEKEGGSDDIAGAGIGTPGFVGADGTVLGGAENLPGWKGTQILAPIRTRFGLAATAANDVTVAALAESRFGAGRGVKNMVCLALGTGIGGGIVIDGKLYRGSHGMAGELGHISVETNGIQCNCGIKGCVEQYASGSGIVNLARAIVAATNLDTPLANVVRRAPSSVTAKTVYDHLATHDAVAVRVHEQACEMLARACGIICNMLSPDRIVIGGGVSKSPEIILEVKKRLANHCWAAIAERTEIVAAQLSEDAGALGAAALVFEDITH